MAAFTSLHDSVGIGLRSPHLSEIMQSQPDVGWLEVHSENWMSRFGPIAETLQEVRGSYPLSLHGVGLSLGSASGLDKQHLGKLHDLVERSKPMLISEHLSWGAINGHHSNDLLPLPYTAEAIEILYQNIDRVQQILGRQILVENISSYCTFEESVMPEWEFVQRILHKTGCGLLLDLNNLYVNACNQGFSTHEYLNSLPLERVAEIHLAGFEEVGDTLIDTHSRPVQPAVWDLFRYALARLPRTTPVLIEWDNELPALSVLLDQASAAHTYLQEFEYDVA